MRNFNLAYSNIAYYLVIYGISVMPAWLDTASLAGPGEGPASLIWLQWSMDGSPITVVW